MHRHKKLLENSQSFFVYCILYFESQNIFPKWVIFVVSYILVSLSDNFLIFDFLVSSSQLGLKLKLNKISNRRHHYISSISFLNNPQSNTNPNPGSIYKR
jgi:hypothetical protein